MNFIEGEVSACTAAASALAEEFRGGTVHFVKCDLGSCLSVVIADIVIAVYVPFHHAFIIAAPVISG